MAPRAGAGYDPPMNILRALIACLLSLSLAWASVDQALAHAQMPAGTTVTLCDSTGQGTTITLDASGTPARPHPCTHCLAAHSLALLPAEPPAPSLRALTPAAFAPSLPFARPAPLPPLPSQPRAPPVLA